MVIKLITALIFFTSVHALSFRDAVTAYKEKNYQRSIKIIQKLARGSIKFYSDEALILISKNYEKLGQLKNANMIRNYMIARKYKEEHDEVKQALTGEMDIDDLDELPEGLLKIYYTIFSARYQIYLNKPTTQNKELVKKFAQLLIEQDFKADKAEMILEIFAAEEQRKKDLIYYKKYYLMASYSSWQDEILITDDSTGDSIEINSTAEGTLFYAGMSYGNAFHEYRFQFGLGFGAATVGEDSADFDYFQTSVGETLFSFTSGYLLKTSDNVSIGLSIPLILRIGDFTEPDGFTIEQGTVITAGAFAHLIWKMGNYFLDMEFGKVLKFRSSFINIGVGYEF